VTDSFKETRFHAEWEEEEAREDQDAQAEEAVAEGPAQEEG
jgi:hypothetical protein